MSDQRASEVAFETVIETHLLAHGYVPADRAGFDRARAIFPATVLAFIRETQPKEWAKLEALHGDKAGEQIAPRLQVLRPDPACGLLQGGARAEP